MHAAFAKRNATFASPTPHAPRARPLQSQPPQQLPWRPVAIVVGSSLATCALCVCLLYRLLVCQARAQTRIYDADRGDVQRHRLDGVRKRAYAHLMAPMLSSVQGLAPFGTGGRYEYEFSRLTRRW